MLAATDAEYRAGALAPAKLRELTAQLQSEGVAVLGNVISPATLDALRPKLDLDAAQQAIDYHLGRGDARILTGAGGLRVVPDKEPNPKTKRVQGHLQLGLQRTGEYITPEIIANPLIEQVVSEVLGPGCFLGFVNGNTNCPGSGTQNVRPHPPHSPRTRPLPTVAPLRPGWPAPVAHGRRLGVAQRGGERRRGPALAPPHHLPRRQLLHLRGHRRERHPHRPPHAPPQKRP